MVDFNLGCDPSVDVEIIDKPSNVVFYERVMCFVIAILVIKSALQQLLL